MTGVPIYLVSACASGDEFVAAFRRYADKNGLFIPIGEPLQAGRRARFAVTLRDGGVMIEGEAEIISSARTASVLHGRVGMTLRFLEPDPASQTTLSELERARLAMRPAPPSIPPRPAEIPAEPRPVPPPVQGRIDAVNALAQCVAIGDPDPPPPAIPRAHTKSMPPLNPGGTRVGPPITPTETGLGVPARAPLIGRASTAPNLAPPIPPPIASARTQTMPGTGPAALPPPRPLVLPSQPWTASAAAPSAVPEPTAMPGSAPTEVGGVLVEALPSSDPAIGVVAAPLGDASEDGSARTQVEGGAPSPEPERIEPEPIELAEPTDISQGPPEPQTLAQANDPTIDEPVRPRKTVQGFAAVSAVPRLPAPPPRLPAPPPLAQPIDAHAPTLPPELRFPPTIDEPTPSEGWSVPPDDADAGTTTDPMSPLPRPLEPDAAAQPSPVRQTVSMRKATPRVDAPPTSDAALPSTERAPAAPIAPTGAPSPGATPAAPLPTGDWTIARDPSAPDGWSEPFQTLTPPPPAGSGSPVANAQLLDSEPRDRTLRPDEILLERRSREDQDDRRDREAVEPKVQIDPTLIEAVPLPPPGTPTLPGTPTMPGMIPLDSRLRPMPPDGAPQATPFENPFVNTVSSPGLPRYATPPPGALEGPPMSMAMAVAQPSPFGMQHSPAMAGGPVPAYAGPDYAVSMPSMHDVRFGGDVAPPVHAGQRRVIIVLVSALVAAVIGIVALLATGDSRDASAPAGSGVPQRTRSSVEPAKPAESTAPVTAPPARAAATRAAPATTPPPGANPDPRASAPATAPPAAAVPAPPAAGACFADVSSVPAGADIVIDETRVIGTTPQKVALPCGKPIELVIRKAKLVAASRTVTPTPQGARLRVTLARPTFLVKVSSTPPGATITLNGRSLGVTPTTVKVPAGESSILMIVKDGYATETETVAPKSNGVAVHAELKRIDRKKPW